MAPDLHAWLLETGLVAPAPPPRATALGGGVSSDVWLVEQEGREPFVVKRSVPKLRVQAEWHADPARLRYEFLYLQTLAELVPGAAPRLISHDPSAPFLAMEYLGPQFANWKGLMLAGDIRPDHAAQAGAILGRIHAATAHLPTLRARFATLEYFTQLRIEAYLLATAAKWPGPPGEALRSEAERLRSHQEALVHGDYSPKNMMVGRGRFVVLDCETACFGDPAFDLAFVLNHLCLKGLFHSGCPGGPQAFEALRHSIAALRKEYAQAQPSRVPEIEHRTARLLPMLLLARVDGKSPVEYLDPPRQEHIRRFAPTALIEPHGSLDGFLQAWFEALENRHFCR